MMDRVGYCQIMYTYGKNWLLFFPFFPIFSSPLPLFFLFSFFFFTFPLFFILHKWCRVVFFLWLLPEFMHCKNFSFPLVFVLSPSFLFSFTLFCFSLFSIFSSTISFLFTFALFLPHFSFPFSFLLCPFSFFYPFFQFNFPLLFLIFT